jgi:cystathionine beta-lyase/cystathionine gamma-synthase
MIWLESPTNPTQKIIDIKALSDLVRKTHPDVIIVVDGTFASPFFQVQKFDGSSK